MARLDDITALTYRRLVEIARYLHQPVTYTEIGAEVGMPARGMGKVLYVIQDACLKRGWPTLTVWVVSKTTGLPSIGCEVTSPRQVREAEEASKAITWPDEPWW